MIPMDEWRWFGHAGHFICGKSCQFHMLTTVGPWMVSTVGEYWPSDSTREILAQTRGVTLEGRGDAREADYAKKFGFEEIGYGRKYETMVFQVASGEQECGCPVIADWSEIDFAGYNDAKAANEGHIALCVKWAAITVEEWKARKELE